LLGLNSPSEAQYVRAALAADAADGLGDTTFRGAGR